MTFYPRFTCWEIMHCDHEECPARLEPQTPCWEIARRYESFRNVFNVCRDCIVYILKENAAVLDKKELYRIIKQRGLLKNSATTEKICVFKHAAHG